MRQDPRRTARRWPQLPRPLLLALAVVFATATILYSFLWMNVVRHPGAPVELGFDSEYSATDHWSTVIAVQTGSPAEKAGLRLGDHLLAVNGRDLSTPEPFDQVWFHSQPGDSVELTVARNGEPATLTLRGIFRAAKAETAEGGLARASAQELTSSYPVLFLAVGLAVLFLRVDDRNAWLLALLFGGFIAIPAFPNFTRLSSGMRGFAMDYRAIFLGFFGALFYLFFAVFPARSPLERRAPWLKWVAFVVGACVAVPSLRAGDLQAPTALSQMVGQHAASRMVLGYIYGFFLLGLVSLIGNAFRAPTPEAARKTRVILWGTVGGVVPVALESASRDFWGYHPTFWLSQSVVLVLFLFPLSFAYAVVKHRVLEIPALLKRSARYVLVQRGFIVLLFLVAGGAIVAFARIFSRYFAGESNTGMAASAVFGIAMVWASAPLVKRGTQRIDRAFFRSAYDARMILQDLAEKARSVNHRHALAVLIEGHVRDSLHPKSLCGYFENGSGSLAAEFGAAPAGMETISSGNSLLSELARRGKAWDVPLPEEGRDGQAALSPLAALEPECLVPILGRDSRLMGLLVLGQRLSEEPYSGEDKRLLDSVASQAGITLESIRLAEEMADRMQAERRASDEMEIARQVQSRLFPQTMPPLATMEYAGGCLQARRVGGDYYDFLDLGPGRAGIVLADISGKGISGALLMANLQANLRSQYAIALEDLPRLLTSVNRLFFENTPDDSYATLFFGDYDDATHRLRYANCGHNPPLLLRADGSLERLTAATTVLGLFSVWECVPAEVHLSSGDVLVMYTDGITEAPDPAGEEFGEARLLELIRSLGGLPVSEMISRIHAAVQAFSKGAQADDLTLVIGRVR